MLTLIRNIFLIIYVYIGIFSLNFIIGGDEVYVEPVDKITLSETSECIIIQLKPLVDIS